MRSEKHSIRSLHGALKIILLGLAVLSLAVQPKSHYFELITTFKSPIDAAKGPSRVVYQKFAFSDPDIKGTAVPNSFSLTSGAMFEEGNSFQISFFTFARVGLEWNFQYLGTKALNFPVSDRFAIHAAIPNTNYHYVFSESGIVARVDLNSLSSISEPEYRPLSKNCAFGVLNSAQNGFIVGTMPIMVNTPDLLTQGTGYTGSLQAVMRYVLMPDVTQVLMCGEAADGRLVKLSENDLAAVTATSQPLNKPGGLLYLQKFQLILLYSAGFSNGAVRSTFLKSSDFSYVQNHTQRGNWEANQYHTELFYEEGRYVHLNEESPSAFRGTEYFYDAAASPPVTVQNILKQNIKFSYYPGTLVKLFGDTQYALKDQAFGSTFMLYRRRQCHSNCASCEGDGPEQCTSCSDGNKYLSIGAGTATTPSPCGDCTTPGTFKSQDSNAQKLCKNCFKACATCQDLIGACTSCNNKEGYFEYGARLEGMITCDLCMTGKQTLIKTTCFDAQSIVTVSGISNPYKLDTVSLSAVVQITSADSPKARVEFIRLLTITLRESLVVKYTNLNGNMLEVLPAKVVVNSAGQFMIIDITFLEPLAGTNYRVRFSADRSRGFIDENIVYGLKVFEFDLEFSNRQELAAELTRYGTQGRVLSGVMMGVPIKNQAATDTLSLLVSLDPTGLVTRLSQMLKLISKLYLLNINFGDRLTMFLESIEEYFPLLKEPNQELLVYHSLGSKGKISRKNGLGDIFAKFHWKLILYYLTWILMGWRYVKMNTSEPETIKRSTYMLMYLTPKIHLIMFNMVFMDFVFYGVRSGFQVWSWYSTPMALIAITLFVMDLLYLNQLCTHETYWRFFAIWKSIKDPVQFITHEEKEVHSKGNNDSFFDGSMIGDKTSSFVKNNFSFHSTGKSGNKSSISGVGSVAPPKLPNVEREIDSEKTLRNIEANIDILEMLTSPIMLTRSVCGNRACRTLMFFHYVRMSFFLMVLAGGQNITVLSCLLLIGLEFGRVCFIASIVLKNQRRKVRVFKNSILMFWEMSQSIFLTGFLILCLIMTGYKFDEQVPSSMQLGGVLLILLSVLCEYILFASHLVFMMFEYFRKKKLLEQLKTPPTPVPFSWFIVEKLTPEEKKGQADLDVSELDDFEEEPTNNNPKGKLLFGRKFQPPKQLDNLPADEKKPVTNVISRKVGGSLLRPVDDFGVKPERKFVHGAHISTVIPQRKKSENVDPPTIGLQKHKSSGGTGSGSSDEKFDMQRKENQFTRNDEITGAGDLTASNKQNTREFPTSGYRGPEEFTVENTETQKFSHRMDPMKPPALRIPRKGSENLAVDIGRKKSIGRSPLLNKSPGIPMKFTSNTDKKELVKQGLNTKLKQSKNDSDDKS